jgi:hypothetical protein
MYGRSLERARPKKLEPALRTKARDFENATGAKSAQRVGIEEIPKLLQTARTWGEVHSILATKGMRYELKGSGSLIWIGDTAVKASTIGQEFSRKRMEERFGPPERSAQGTQAQPSEQALRALHAEAGSRWTEYRSFLDTYKVLKDEVKRALRVLHRSAREEQTNSFRRERKSSLPAVDGVVIH